MPSRDLVEVEETDGELVEVETPESISEEIVETTKLIARLAGEAAAAAAAGAIEPTGTALVPMSGSAKQAKKQLAGLRVTAARAEAVVHEKREEIKEAQRHVEDLMRRQMDIATRQLAPLQKYMKRLEEGIWMVNLYLGRDEEIVRLLEGEPAPVGEQIVIRQLVLAMDEECAVNPYAGGIDSTDIELFDAWLKKDPANVEQVIPFEKGIVALRPRYHSKEYEDPWKRGAVKEADEQTYFLIRNGRNLYRTWTNFKAGKLLVSKQDEFASYFYEERTSIHSFGANRGAAKHRIPIEPGTPAWERAEEAADARQRHYMRVGLILQGLVDRTTVFHPLPDGMSFLDWEQGGKTWRFFNDAEDNMVTSGRPAFNDWLRAKNKELQAGMRIVGSFGRYYRESEDPYRFRIHPSGAERPPSKELLTVEDLTASSFVVRYKRKEKGWRRGRYQEDGRWWTGWHEHEFSTRAACRIERDERTFLPFDLVTVEEMEVYLGSRLERHAYAEMFPLLRAAIRAKHAEVKEEAPFRTMLAGVLARDNGVEVAEAIEALDDLIGWWKLTNKTHRPLVGSEEEQAKAVRMITAEHARRLKAKSADDVVVATIRSHEPGAILVARKRDGKYIALVPENDEDIFVAEHLFTARGVRSGEAKRWQLLSLARYARWKVAFDSERLRKWNTAATLNDYLTGPEFERLSDQMLDRSGERIVAVAYREREKGLDEARGAGRFHVWRVERDNDLEAGKKWRVEHAERGWKRRNGVARLTEEYSSHTGEWIDQRAPWDTRRKDGKKSQWRDTSRNLFTVLFHDPKLEAHVEQQKVEWRAREADLKKTRYHVYVLLHSIEEAWVKRKEAEVYERFLEDYLDPELWEGHKKGLDRDVFAYPYKHDYREGWNEAKDPLLVLVEHVVAEGINVDGMTVWETAQAHFPALEDGEPYEVTVMHGGGEPSTRETRRVTAPKPEGIHEDLRELRFVEPVPEPEDEDEEDLPWE